MPEPTWYKKKADIPTGYKYALARDYPKSAAKEYAVFREHQQLVEYLDTHHGSHLNEIILSEKVYLYFDIDMKADVKLNNVIGIFLLALRAFLKQVCNIDVFWVIGQNCHIGECVRKGKCSFHFVSHDIIVDSLLIHKKLALAFIDFILEYNFEDLLYHDPDTKRVECAVDASIYGTFRCFRCLHMSKTSVGVPLRPYKESSTKASDHLINCHDDNPDKIHITHAHVKYGREVATKTILKKISVDESDEDDGVCTTEIEKVKNLIQSNDRMKELLQTERINISYTYSLRDNRYSFLIDKSCRPICPFIKRMHTNNHLCVCYNATRNSMYLKCMSPKCLEKYHSMRYMLCPSTSVRDRVHDIANLDSLHTQQEAIQWTERYCEETMRDYPDNEFLCIRGGMGVGKTKALKKFAHSHFGTNTKVLVVTFSRNLAAKYAAEFGDMGFVSYQDVKSTIINDGKVIVCLDSLWRVVMRNPDYVIIDEALSVFLHFNSPLMQRSSENTTLLELLVHQAKHCFMLDACIDNGFMKNVVDYLAVHKKVPVHWIWNEYIRPTNRVAKIHYLKQSTYKSISKQIVQSKTIQNVIELIDAGKKVVVCSSTKKFTTILGALLKEKYSGLNICVINSDTSSSSDEIIDTNKWKEYDVLIYSPSITAGVSFEELHFDALVCFLANTHFTPTIDVTLQQLFRVRRLREGGMFIYMYDEPGSDRLPMDNDSIEHVLNTDNAILREYYKHINFYSQQRVENGVLVYDTDRLSYQILKGIIMMKNRSRVFYVDTLKRTLQEDYGIPCTKEDIVYDAIVDVGIIGEIDDIQNNLNTDIPFSTDLVVSEAEYYILCDKGDLNDVEKMQKRLFEFQHFMWKVENVDEEFYNKYVACKSAYKKYHKAQRFNKLVTSSEADINREFNTRMEAITMSYDPTMELFKNKYKDFYKKLICGSKLLKTIFTDEQWRTITTKKGLKIAESDLEEKYKRYLSTMTYRESQDFMNSFALHGEDKTAFMSTRKVLDDAFGIHYVRGHRSTTRAGYTDLYLIRDVPLGTPNNG